VGDDVMVGLGTIVVLGVGMQWVARRIRLPAILLLLASGLVVGPWLGIVEPDEIFGDSLFPIVSMAVALLLFEGGLGLDIADLRRRGARPVVQLVTVGVAITWGLVSVVAGPLLDLPTDLAVLLGALVVVSGPTVVGPLLRLARPREPTATILRWEGIVIDPVGATLALVVLKVVIGGENPVVEMVLTAAVGSAVGVVAAALLVLALRTFAVPDDLEPAVTFMLVIAAYVGGELLFEEGGLFAATAFGVALANQSWVQVRRIAAFGHDVGVLVLGGLFVVLAARVSPQDFNGIIAPTLVLVAFLVLVVRPIVGWVCTSRARLPTVDRLFVGALAPRGIVAAATSSLFALRLDQAGHDDGRIEAIVFVVIAGTCLVYGLLCAPLARRLGVAEPEPSEVLLVGSQPWVLDLADTLGELDVEVVVLASGQVGASDAGRRWRLITTSPLSESFASALERVRSAVVVSLDDAHNAVVVARALEVLPRREVFVLPTDRRQATTSVEPVAATALDAELTVLPESEMEAAPARAWERRPFAPGTTQTEIDAAHRNGRLRTVRGPATIADTELLLVVRPAGAALDLAPRRRVIHDGDVAVVLAGAASD
jgi:NhaP-type Na+/H+ or K+/H+ antiporter